MEAKQSGMATPVKSKSASPAKARTPSVTLTPPARLSSSSPSAKAPRASVSTPPRKSLSSVPSGSSPKQQHQQLQQQMTLASKNRPSGEMQRSVKKSRSPKQQCSDTSTPSRALPPQVPQPPFETPERQGTRGESKPQNNASPSVPPAPAPTPVPRADKTPRRESQSSQGVAVATTPTPVKTDNECNSNTTPQRSMNGSARRSAQKRQQGSPNTGHAATALSPAPAHASSVSVGSPVPPPPPPTTPTTVKKKQPSPQHSEKRSASSSVVNAAVAPAPASPSKQQQQQHQQQQRSSSATSAKMESKNGSLTQAAPQSPAKHAEPAIAKKITDNSNDGKSAAAAAVAPLPQSNTKKDQRSHKRVHRQPPRDAAGTSTSSRLANSIEHFIQESKVVAPDVSGVRCMAVHPSEAELVVARENGSLVRYDVSFFQNVPQFVQVRHTGGQTRRTITSLAYVAVPPPTSASTTAKRAENGESVVDQNTSANAPRYVLVASMMSGQIVVYDAELLVPLSLHQRSGGAIWQLTAANAGCIYAAMADGSWQQLALMCKREDAAPQLELVRVVPGISGADRALTVTTSALLRMAVGTDDAGNVHAWRLPASASEDETVSVRARGLAEHESLWTTKLAKGIGMSCAVVGGAPRPCVVVGTSMGDVVLLDAGHGHVFQAFSQHKGPVTTLAVHQDKVVFASGWHESLRSYRCNGAGDWHPAEVKRRTHYHEASQLALLPQRRLILSASRDGTVMYAPLAELFTAPANYVVVTTQQFAYAAQRNVLLQSRFDTIEAFRADAAGRHWVPFFGHRLSGRFHLTGLWCDEACDYIVFSTEERAGLLKVAWRDRGAAAITRLEEVLELPAGTGVVDVCWSSRLSNGTSQAPKLDDEKATATAASEAAHQSLYILYDDAVTSVTLAEGYPAVYTPLHVRGKALPADSVRPYRVFCRASHSSKRDEQAEAASANELAVYGRRGSCRVQLMVDGTPDADTVVVDLDDVYEHVREVPLLTLPKKANDFKNSGEPNAKKTKTEKSEVTAVVSAPAPVLVGLSTKQQQYVAGSTVHSAAPGLAELPATLPHDVKWIARVSTNAKDTGASSASCIYLGYFSRGLLVAGTNSWHMLRRMSVEAAFVVKDNSAVLVLDRNLEKTLEALPLTWKVRRFGN